MATGEASLVARITAVAAIIGITGGVFAFFDARYALSGEVREMQQETRTQLTSLQQLILSERLDRIDFEIEELERRSMELFAIPDEELTVEQRKRRNDMEVRRDRYIRKRELIVEEMKAK